MSFHVIIFLMDSLKLILKPRLPVCHRLTGVTLDPSTSESSINKKMIEFDFECCDELPDFISCDEDLFVSALFSGDCHPLFLYSLSNGLSHINSI